MPPLRSGLDRADLPQAAMKISLQRKLWTSIQGEATIVSEDTKSSTSTEFQLCPVGVIRSEIKTRAEAPKQGSEGAPDVWLEVYPWAADGLHLLAEGDELVVITWFHQAHRDVLKVHPRSNPRNPLTGVFATRSPDRPNPLGLHPVVVRAIDGHRLRIGPIEAIDGTPVIDIKPVLSCTPRDASAS
jgi:tRNA-Thr(GGU) m(6)t(6)A37 methyltransferase TsaA